jgi:archaellum component FlaC
MADKVSEGIEDALNLIVSTTERSRNMKKELKQTIFETVSTLRNLFVKLKCSRDSISTEISELEMQVTKIKAELEECSGKNAERHLLS